MYFPPFSRITPVYMVIMVSYVWLYHFVGDSPIYPKAIGVADKCKQDWWHHILFINNIVGTRGNVAFEQVHVHSIFSKKYINYDMSFFSWFIFFYIANFIYDILIACFYIANFIYDILNDYFWYCTFYLWYLNWFFYIANFIYDILVHALVVVFSLYNAVLPNHPNTLYDLSMVCITSYITQF